MPRAIGDGPRAKKFDELILQGVEPLEAAKQAGYAQPLRYVKTRQQYAERDRNLAAAGVPTKRKRKDQPEQPPESDQQLGRRTLRTIATLSNADTARVQASKALLDSAAESKEYTERTIVVFDIAAQDAVSDNGTHSLVPGRTVNVAGVDADQVTAAIAFVEAERARGREAAIAEITVTNEIEREDLELALYVRKTPALWRVVLQHLHDHPELMP